MRAQDLMSPNPVTVSPEMSVAEVWDLMREPAIRHIHWRNDWPLLAGIGNLVARAIAPLDPQAAAVVQGIASHFALWEVEHARDFAERYAEPMNYHVENRMMELGIQEIGMPDANHGIRWAAFHPHGTIGGSYSPDGRLIADSGVLNTDLLKAGYDEKAAGLFERSRLRDRLDAIIAHEYEEHRHGMSHTEALKAAPKTELPISQEAREICREMEWGWKR